MAQNTSDDSLTEAALDLGEAALAASMQLKRTIGVAQSAISVVAEEHPFALLGAAAGVGFVVGGGLAGSITRAAVRLAGAFVIEQALDSLLRNNSSVLRRATSPESASGDTSSAQEAR